MLLFEAARLAALAAVFAAFAAALAAEAAALAAELAALPIVDEFVLVVFVVMFVFMVFVAVFVAILFAFALMLVRWLELSAWKVALGTVATGLAALVTPDQPLVAFAGEKRDGVRRAFGLGTEQVDGCLAAP